jgi:hypothetical protein
MSCPTFAWPPPNRCETPCNGAHRLQPTVFGRSRAKGRFGHRPTRRLQKSPSKNENPQITVFFIFSPNEAGGLGCPLLKHFHSTAVQPHCISLQSFAICEIADRLQSPTARLGCSFVCTTSDFAQKKDTNPVGGRGISAFPGVFSMPCTQKAASTFNGENAATLRGGIPSS